MIEWWNKENEEPTALVRDFMAFDAKHPLIYKKLRKLALELRRKGIRKYGIKALFEMIRYHHSFPAMGEEYKLSNNHAPYYARKLMKEEEELHGFFDVRPIRGGSKQWKSANKRQLTETNEPKPMDDTY